MIWQNYHVSCDKCGLEERIPVYPLEIGRDSILDVLHTLGWLVDDEEIFCPKCKAERKNEHPGEKALREWAREGRFPKK